MITFLRSQAGKISLPDAGRISRNCAILLIRIYQRTLSLDHGPLRVFFPYGFCRFDPSCSEYTAQAIDKHGTVKGTLLGSWRILRCNPWNKGGEDPVK